VHPILFKIGAFEIRSYGFMLALSFVFGIMLATRRAKKRDLDPNVIMDLSVVLILCSIIGSRFLYVVYHLEEFRGRWLDTINPFQSDGSIGISGLTVLGGIVLCFIGAWVFLHMKKLNFFEFADIIVPSVGLGIFLTRIGCFLNGCCYGLPCDAGAHLCVTFPFNSPAGAEFPGVPLVPTQLYSAVYGLIILFGLLYLERWKKFEGFLLAWFIILYGISRFIIDIFRYYEDSMVLIELGQRGLGVNQGISLLFVLAGIAMLWVGRKRGKLV